MHTRRYLIGLLVPSLLGAGGCATQSGGSRPVLEPTSGSAMSAPTPKRAATYPNAKLTDAVLYDLLVSDIAAQRGQAGASVKSLLRAAEKTQDPRLAERATSLALYAKDYERARIAAQLWVRLQGDSADAHQALAETLLQNGQLEPARAQFAEVLKLSDTASRGHAYLKIAAALGRHTDRPAALQVMEGLVATHPDVREAHYALAHLTVRMGDFAASLTAIDRALALAPGWEEGAIFKARVLVSLKDTQNAVTFFESYLKTYPQATSLRLNFARYLIDLKQWNKARAQFKQVAGESPQDADALYAVGLLALQANQFEESKKYLKLNLERQPENDQARLYLGQIAEQEKNYTEAENWYQGIEGDAHRFEAQARLALIKSARGDVAGAREQLRAIQPQTDQQRVQLVLSEDQILRDARQHAESLKVLSAGLESMPDEPDLLYARALVAEKLNMIELHEADLRRILKKDPKNAHALNALGYTLADRTQRYDEALALIEQALMLKPEDPFIMDSMGWVQYRMGNNAEAIRLLKRAFAIRNDAEISAHLGEVLWVTGDRAAAESVWRDALKETPDNEALLSIIKKFKP